ncbi:hypothetical protein MRB53_032223 [Persea americana]|uniref:Uncharacterized protein n=1 Tax=Persea americana TaxID=3435 RepID=A0ACC2KS05_PERAE|nr:hypothetical protein MRB53_032223 [Persea americana]
MRKQAREQPKSFFSDRCCAPTEAPLSLLDLLRYAEPESYAQILLVFLNLRAVRNPLDPLLRCSSERTSDSSGGNEDQEKAHAQNDIYTAETVTMGIISAVELDHQDHI